MRVRQYRIPYGRVEDLFVIENKGDEERVREMEARNVHPAIERLSTGAFSITLEADDLEQDIAIAITKSRTDAINRVRDLVHDFNASTYDEKAAHWNDGDEIDD